MATKKTTDKAQTTELEGQCSILALLFPVPHTPLEDVGISKYKILPCETMHVLSNNITNLLEEPPNHITEDVVYVL